MIVVLLAFAAATSAGAAEPARDPAIAAFASSVSAARLRSDDQQLVAFGTRNAFSELLADRKRGVFAARDWLKSTLETIAATSGGRMTVALDTYVQPKTARTPRDVTISSVVATLRGDDAAAGTYLITSHYDSRNSDGNDATLDAPGADDNGSGVVCMLEAARVLAPHHFRATIIFAAYDGEEQGLFGSSHHAEVLLRSGADVEGVLNNDIIGASRGHGGVANPYVTRLFSEALPAAAKPAHINALGAENDSPSRELARAVKEAAALYVPRMDAQLIYREDRFLRGGDQESFTERGFPAVRFVEAHENFDHQHQTIRVQNGVQYGDLLQFMDFAYLARVTQMNVAALATLAIGPPRPQRVAMLARDLGYDTTLQWQGVASAASYEVLWRRTFAPLWEHARNVGAVTSVTLPLSKDDYLFAVRSVDAQGHRSVAVFPEPLRGS